MVIWKQEKKKEKAIPILTIKETETEFVCNGLNFLKKKVKTNDYVIGITKERKKPQAFLVIDFKNFYYNKVNKERKEIKKIIYKKEEQIRELKKKKYTLFSKEAKKVYTLEADVEGLHARFVEIRVKPLTLLKLERW